MERENSNRISFIERVPNEYSTDDIIRSLISLEKSKQNSLRASQSYSEAETRFSTSSLRSSEELRSSFNFSALRGSQGARASFGVASDEVNEENTLTIRKEIIDKNNLINLNTQEFNLRGGVGVFRNNIKNIEKNYEKRKIGIIGREKSEAESTSLNMGWKKIQTEKYTYMGSFNKNNKRDGFGICYYSNGDQYTGYWANDIKQGWGKYTNKSSGKIFRGEFQNNQIEGFVEYVNKQGIIHQGMMKNLKFVNEEVLIIHSHKYELNGVMQYNNEINKLCGVARIKYKNGDYYEGETVECSENGWGIIRKSDNTIIRGEIGENRIFNSYCEIQCPNGEKHFGWFLNNKKHGLGISISKKGNYSIGRYSEDFKDGAFAVFSNENVKLEIHNLGFLTKTIDKKENIINYLCLVYPEFKWLSKVNNKILSQLIKSSINSCIEIV